ncbi:HAD family hydrolase [Brevibacterium atlanticum]|uniref:HAD family hydrolase n=1 Tax=Brevibacterium atlanticum TaxID=2697563 RepID=UPI00142251AB|nr:HAD family hydrolase [Brevibacterium atlanticum]
MNGSDTTDPAVPADLLTPIRAVVFDVGETLVDEHRTWEQYAATVGVPVLTVFAMLGALIERREDHRQIWNALGVEAPVSATTIANIDLYDDAAPCLQAAKTAGLVVGIAGNQPAGAVEQLQALGLSADFVASSFEWKIAKPAGAFFTEVVRFASVDAAEILYVGDRIDNDIIPAKRAGMMTAFLRRGPWGQIQRRWPEADAADLTVDSLDELRRMLSPQKPHSSS